MITLSIRSVLVLAVALVLTACGSDSPTAPSAPQTPAPTVLTSNFSNLPVNVANQNFWIVPFTVSVSATVTVRVEWTPAAPDVDVALLTGNCLTTLCNVANAVGIAISATANPEVINAGRLDPGTYSVLVENLGPLLPSGTITITIQP